MRIKSFLRQAALFLPLFVLLATVVVHAQQTPCTSSSGNCLNSPLSSSLSSIPAFLAAVLSGIAKIGLPIISVYFVIVGYMFIAAQGKPVDTGGYYLPDTKKTSAGMRPSKTLNEALAKL